MADVAALGLKLDTPSPPPQFFRHAAVRIARHSLGQIQLCDQALPEAVRIQALHILTYALHLGEHWPLARDLLLRLAEKLEQSGYREGWRPLLEYSLQLSQRYNDRNTAAELQLHLGYLCQLHGDLAAAAAHYAASADLFGELGQPARRARVLNRYAFTARQQQKRPQALQLISEVYQLVAADHPERGNAQLVQGWLALDERNWQLACDSFTAAKVIFQRSGTRYQLASALRELAVPLHMLARDEEAMACFAQATTLFAQLGNRFQQAVVSMNWGIIYLARQQIPAALALFAEAEPVFRQLQDDEHLGKLYLNQALAYRASGELPQCVRLLQASIALFEQIGNSDWLVNAMDELGLSWWQMGDRQRAMTTFQAALTLLSASPNASTYRRNQISGHLQTALQATTNQVDACTLELTEGNHPSNS